MINNTQLLLSVGIPTLAVIIAMIRNEQSIAALRADIRGDIRVLTDSQMYQHGREIEALTARK